MYIKHSRHCTQRNPKLKKKEAYWNAQMLDCPWSKMSLNKFFIYLSSESQIFFMIDKHFIVSENSIVWYWYPSSWKKCFLQLDAFTATIPFKVFIFAYKSQWKWSLSHLHWHIYCIYICIFVFSASFFFTLIRYFNWLIIYRTVWIKPSLFEFTRD